MDAVVDGRSSVSVAGARTVSPRETLLEATCAPISAVVMLANITSNALATMPSDQTRKPCMPSRNATSSGPTTIGITGVDDRKRSGGSSVRLIGICRNQRQT